MSSIILHISDLHVSLDKKYDGTPKQHDSYLSATEADKNILYLECFIKFAKEESKGKTIFLLITGDTTDWGEQNEFSYALKYLNKIVDDLSIEKKNILLIPGDHDLNRRSLETLIAEKLDRSIDEKNDAKFKNFSDFYENFLGRTFNPNKIIFDSLIIENSIALIGVNSSYGIDLEQKLGFISIEKFETELKTFNTENDLKNIMCCHHNITSVHENKKSGQWDPDNRKRLIAKLQENDINFIFSGNEHTSSLEKIASGEITISDAGALSSTKYDSAFKIYELSINDDIVLTNKIYGLQKTGDFDNPYYWDSRTNTRAKQDEYLKIFIKNQPRMDSAITDLTTPDTAETPAKSDNGLEKIQKKENTPDNYYNPEFTDVLYSKVKDLKIFHTGHFHWSETSRAHNWIDVSKLIENRDNLNFLKNAIIDVLDKKIGSENIDLIIGLGYEGNILATKSAIKFDKPYSFLPYSYRHHEHHDFETELNYENDSKQYKNVLIVTDVVNDGRTIRKLIKKRQSTFFGNVDKVYVISLFYTGESILNYDVLNFNFIKTIPNYDLQSDEEVNNIQYYTVKSLKVEKCPYGKNFREECFIYKDDLSCVNLFYDEKKYISKQS
ncbi:metallophosphoesterase [Flavobacterium aquidurense]|uniref:metallophosphoesterase n=1 Tax=Flavobacterium aquidurense TaxID=362413 RepID=UPI00371E807F